MNLSVWSRGRTLAALPLRGAALLSIITLAACAGPMSQREAQVTALYALRGYCADTVPCAPYRVGRTQRLGDGWLVDFESATSTYGVMVHRNGSTEVTNWQKNS